MNAVVETPSGNLIQRYLLTPVLNQLRQGITPEKIALTLALGAVCSVFPILGMTTVLCGILGVWLRLNQALIQSLNYLLTPLHVALLLPFYRAGETLFGQPHVPIFSITDLIERFREGPLQFFADYGMVGLYGVTVWALTAPIVSLLLYLSLRPLILRLARVSAD
ncbi:DUF2062 domain-containing protein [Sinimarinibacterium sp. CAU 1509]|uniref:DUF2062 domain-containing protein n=1 Tax=Sinimarinibacterium sp. CAU 1509 TaxID=2562283 RepID=UPI0010AC1520|nr:DUF2062 domain-containing protein [Sinimarinibacterium sp. CAU 1509]TJY59818.1 DUF2062 domain-containing protein [Sinimarinibacterium sp. CAU 1509]